MVKRIGRTLRKSKSRLTQYYKDKGKIPLSLYFQEFNPGDKVALTANLAVIPGRYFRRFHGHVGTITGKKGRCYQVALKDGQKLKTFNVHPVHLKKL